MDLEKIRKIYLRKTRKLLETNCFTNLSKEINTVVDSQEKYSGPFLNCTKERLKKLDQRARKSMTMHQGFHSKHLINKLSKKGRGIASVDAIVQRLEEYKIDLKKFNTVILTKTT